MSKTPTHQNHLKQIKWNALSFATISWVYPLLRIGYRKPLTEADLPPIGTNESAAQTSKWLTSFASSADAPGSSTAKSPSRSSLISQILPNILPMILLDAFCALLVVATTVIQPLLIGEVINFLDPTFPSNKLFIQNGYALAFVLFTAFIVYAIATSVVGSIGFLIQVRVKGALVSAIYRKSLHLSPKSRHTFNAGSINSFIGSDTTALIGSIDAINKLWSVPLQVAIVLYFLSTLLKISTVVCAVVFVGCGFLSSVTAPRIGAAMKEYLAALDTRTTHLREFLYGVKLVKYSALETPIAEKINKARTSQVKALVYRSAWFIVYGALGNDMSQSIVFPALSFFGGLISVSSTLPRVIGMVMQGIVSYRRVNEFLEAEEVAVGDVIEGRGLEESDSGNAVLLKEAGFSWESVDSKKASDKKGVAPKNVDVVEQVDTDVFALDGISVSIKRGSLVAVVGATGSGKSSLLAALAGSMRKTGGEAVIYGTIGYCPQEPWIISGTIEENITLLDNNLVDSCAQAISACSLTKDLTSFSAGIYTQIGEKGINLSGGQKARLALARAIAHNPDVYILDDPLSALDAHVSKEIFKGAIQGPLMKSKTVVIATHLLHILPQVDQVIVMDGGKIVQNGTFAELMADAEGKLVDTMKDYHLDETEGDVEEERKVVSSGVVTAGTFVADEKKESAVAEDREVGSVSFDTYKTYARAIGAPMMLAQLLIWLLLSGSFIVQQLTLGAWTTNLWGFTNPNTSYLILYSGFSIGASLVDLINFVLTLYVSVRGSSYFHDKALEGLMRAPMSFFDAQPIGRMLNRMTADVRVLDIEIGLAFNIVLFLSSSAVGNIIITMITAWQVIPICAGLVVAIYLFFRFFRSSYRELRRLSSIMASPLTAHMSETMTGISTIIAYNAESAFVEKQLKTLDQANLSFLLFNHTMLWITLRLNVMNYIVTYVVVLLGVSGVIPYSLVGLALTQIMMFAPTINGMLLMTSSFEANMVAAERLGHYAHNLPSEAARILPKDDTLNNWPSGGLIEIDSLKLAYEARPNHLVVNGISLKIQAGEKVGVVGRTGSGKSTLMDSFFRLIEAREGSILIDGQDISTLGLTKLRSSIQMIPQNPTLFDGTVRSNIDVLAKYSDDDLWYALECVGMKEYVSGLNGKLDSPVTEGGTNLSAGQRQLLCLAKVLLQKSKILIMDEATSSVDAESDLRIQESMKTYFKDATVLSVAHRLNTIAAFDKVLVLENGRVAEFEPPHLLLSREGTIFGEMVNATGVANAAVIREIAKDHYLQ
ncbi:P-loop containing nucleoside triphosphate hydrolase protein [Rhizoclosmatium globosum]|uniref:p-loop containing nucleoside triphosphate hydrolase protein n=1 Tax=Rhizoclosmatium globosum TaxID=329046 RepID=A0A1Y2BZD9_9FUNG|nr:P-loop containing nucleoside triphosphate hydrolase protein [Rhizoclosmatium globosum]|eukprot:ORY40142.1 P-loop containing nucleoside triphosphate hydrolase protein [Rhizoclosmatium globosum]